MRTAGATRYPDKYELSLVDVARFWDKVDRIPDGCWMWKGGTNHRGYGQFGRRAADGTVIGYRAHRLAYELMVGPIPDGLLMDHLCHQPGVCSALDRCEHRRCVNPHHLKIVTDSESNLRR